MEFEQKDRDMLHDNDTKLKTLCTNTKNMADTLVIIKDQLAMNALGCAENRAACQKELCKTINDGDDKCVKTKTFWPVITIVVIGLITQILISIKGQ